MPYEAEMVTTMVMSAGAFISLRRRSYWAQFQEGDVLILFHFSPSPRHRYYLRLDIFKPPRFKPCRIENDRAVFLCRIQFAGEPLIPIPVCVHQIFLWKTHLFKFEYLHNRFWVFY